ncbi:hypothetical protein AVEN_247854-1 [Araneus ventricosus]|uniref:Large T antigen polyomavirus C-terminal domain-containing protein n=1 Tax=Araneus ventricosus TaxID=182803 RepID=A0A4Y2B3B4_ARAVE|nr:hypothetical protein AVEN_247854-1 [Araneus ventricosus]
MKLYRRIANQLSYFGMYGMRTDEDLVCILMLLTSDYRLADVKKECRNLGISPVEAFYATKVGKCIEFYKGKFGQLKEEPVKYPGNASTPDHSKKNELQNAAIGKRFILFDGVKGRSLGSENLPSGPGFANLDDLRDHIDGHVEVQLEKKKMQPISQVFPCGIITCNDYHIHQSLNERIIGPIEMKASPLFPFHAAQRITEETIFIGLVLYNLLPAEAHILEFLYKNKRKWESEHMQSNCNCLNVSRQMEQENRKSECRGDEWKIENGLSEQM